MKRKTVNIINFENVGTIYNVRNAWRSFHVLEHSSNMPKVDLETVTRPYDMKDLLDQIFSTLDEDQEHLVLLILNAAHELRGFKVIASGGVDHVETDPRIVYRNALLLGATKIILAHNHPTGGGVPSKGDLRMTRQIAEAGKLLNLELLDHVIWTDSDVFSIRKHSPECFNP